MTTSANGLAGTFGVAGIRKRFRLVPFFTMASLMAFLLVAGALWYFQHQQDAVFRGLQGEQAAVVRNTQEDFASRQEEIAHRDLLAVHEAGNVNLARILANVFWESDLAPYVARASQLPADHCRTLPDESDPATGAARPSPEKKACFAEIGKALRASPEFAGIDTRLFAAMTKSTVFKVKVFDLRGITVYSSEHAQIGEDKRNNRGWRGAATGGQPMTELTFRDRFSAFEGVVENRDLISSYVPIRAESGAIVGVFEIYTDVTPFLAHVRETTATLRRATADNQAIFEASTRDSEARLGVATLRTLFFVMGTLLFLFVVLFVVIHHAAGIMAKQERDRERAQHQLAQWEKMASLGQMVASVTHQLNSPLAFGQSNLHMALQALERFRLPLRTAATFTRLVRGARGEHVNITVAPARKMVADAVDDDFDAETPKAMLEDTLHGLEQMRDLVSHLGEFTRLDRGRANSFDLARSLRNVIYIAHSTMPTDIRVVEEFAEIPEARGNVSQLNQVFLNLINNAAQAITGPGTITVRTSLADGRIRIDIADTGCGIAEEYRPHIWDDYFTTKPPGEGTGLGLGIARTIVAEHGGEITVDTRTGADSGTTFSIYLPVAG